MRAHYYKMKNYFFFLLACFVFTKSFAQTDSIQIVIINKTKQEIKDSVPSYQMLEKATDPSGGYRHAYLKNGTVALTVIYHRDGYIDKNVEWYFSDGKLIYSEQIWTNVKTGEIVDDEKFYLRDGRLFAWIKTNSKFVDKESRQFKNFDSGLEAYAIKLQADAR